MKILHLVAGAGGMYCGACLHGNTLAAALRKAGEDVILAPVYTPLRTDEEDASTGRVVFGGVNVYLQQRSPLFRRTPRVLDRLLDSPALLRRLGRRSLGTRLEVLGALAVSVLQGEEGRQRKELDKLLGWLEREVRPEVVHLSTALLAGMARRIQRELNVPVVATLSGEDGFVERLPEPHGSRARALLQERSRELAAMVAMNRYYADFMAEYLAVPRERLHVIPPGLNLEGHAPLGAGHARAGAGADRHGQVTEPVTIGFLSRVCQEKGLHLLAEAFALLAAEPGLPPLRLAAAGYLAEADRPYLAEIESRLAAQGLADRFEYLGELDRAEKIAFLQSLDVMSTPTVLPESKGLPVLEAWANGVPVVLPAHGVFPELIEDTGGGLLTKPNDAAALAEVLKRLIRNADEAAECGRRGQEAVYDRYCADLMARRTMALYETVCRGRR